MHKISGSQVIVNGLDMFDMFGFNYDIFSLKNGFNFISKH